MRPSEPRPFRQPTSQRGLDSGLAMPPAVFCAVLSLLAHVAIHLAVPVIMYTQRRLFEAQFQQMTPDQPVEQVIATVNAVLRAGLIYHLVFGALFVWLALMIRTGRNWARIIATVVSALGSLGTFVSFSSATPMPWLYKPLNILSWLLALATVALLWAPPQSRAFFAPPERRAG